MRISDWSSDVCSSDLTDGTITFGGGSQYSDRVTYIGSGDSSNRNWIMQSGPQRRLLNQGSGTLRITGDILMLVATSFEANTAGFDLLGVLSGGATSVSFPADASREIILGGANNNTGANGIGGAGVVKARS